MYRSILFVVFFIRVCINTYGQYNYASNTIHVTIVEAISLNNNIIEERSANFEKKAQSKPLMFVNVKKKIALLNEVSNSLSKFITSLQKEVGSERILYELLEDDFYENILFTKDEEFTDRGKELMMKTAALYQVSKTINVHGLTGLSDFATQHFKTDEVYYDAQERKINYFEYLFYDTSNYGIMMSLNALLLDVKVFQLMYYRTVMSY